MGWTEPKTGRMALIPIRIYYEDTDFSGVVYHAAYLRFMERGRTEFLRARGMAQGAAHAGTGFGFAVRAMGIEFLKPARMDDLIQVETLVTETGGASIVMAQKILRGADTLVTATVRIAVLRHGRAARLPPEMRALFTQEPAK